MFKNETLVKMALVTGLALISLESYGADNSSRSCHGPGSPYETLREARQQLRAAGANAPNRQELLDAVNEAQDDFNSCTGTAGSGGGSAETCKTAATDFNKARTAFHNSCKGLPTKSISGNISCGWHVARCNCPSTNPESEEYQKLECATAQAAVASGSNVPSATASLLGLRDNAAARAQYGHCALAAATDLEKLEKEIREAQKEVRDAEKRIPELEAGVADARTARDEKLVQARQKLVDAEKQRAQQRADYIKQQREQMKNIAAQVTQLQSQITTQEEAISRIALESQKDGELARMEAVNAVEARCHDQAIATVAADQAKKMANPNAGGFNKMLEQTGMSSRQAWQKVATVHYNRCMQSKIVRSQIKRINDRYNGLIDKARDGERNATRRIRALETQVRQLQNNNGCSGAGVGGVGGTGVEQNGSTSESQACQAFRTMQEDIRRADADHAAAINQANVEAATARQSGDAKILSKGRELADARRTVREERLRLENLREALNLKRQFGEGASLDAKEAGEARAKHQEMVLAAYTIISCTNQSRCGSINACKDARNYLTGTLGRNDLTYKDSTARDAAPTPRATPEPGQQHERNDNGNGTRERENDTPP